MPKKDTYRRFEIHSRYLSLYELKARDVIPAIMEARGSYLLLPSINA